MGHPTFKPGASRSEGVAAKQMVSTWGEGCSGRARSLRTHVRWGLVPAPEGMVSVSSFLFSWHYPQDPAFSARVP